MCLTLIIYCVIIKVVNKKRGYINMKKFILYEVDEDYTIIRKITQRKNKFSRQEINKIKKKYNINITQREVNV